MASLGLGQQQMERAQGARAATWQTQHAAQAEFQAAASSARHMHAEVAAGSRGCEARCAGCGAALAPSSGEAVPLQVVLEHPHDEQQPGPASKRRDTASQPCSSGMASSHTGGADGGHSLEVCNTAARHTARPGGLGGMSAPTSSESADAALSGVQDMESSVTRNSSTTSPAAAAHVLRFDPAAGDCGAFFILKAASRHAAGMSEPENAAALASTKASTDAPPLTDGALSTASDPAREQKRSGDSAPAQPCSTALERQRRNAGQHEAGTGAAGQNPWPGSEAASSRGATCKRTFDSSLPDLVAEVEALVGGHTSGERPQPALAAGEYCRQWVSALVRAHADCPGQDRCVWCCVDEC